VRKKYPSGKGSKRKAGNIRERTKRPDEKGGCGTGREEGTKVGKT